jgi:hypothetical protein
LEEVVWSPESSRNVFGGKAGLKRFLMFANTDLDPDRIRNQSREKLARKRE